MSFESVNGFLNRLDQRLFGKADDVAERIIERGESAGIPREVTIVAMTGTAVAAGIAAGASISAHGVVETAKAISHGSNAARLAHAAIKKEKES